MSTTIESLELEILSSSQSAESGLDKLATTLGKLKLATKGGLGLTAVAKQLKAVNTAVNGISADSVNNVKGLAKAIELLNGKKISSTIAKQLTAVNTALNGADFTSGKGKIEDLVTALKPLETLGKSSLSTTVSALDKLPKNLSKLDTRKLYTQIDSLTRIFRPLADEMQKIANGFSVFPTRIQKVINSTDNLTASNKKASLSYTDFYSKFKMVSSAAVTVASKIASCISETNDYIEDVHLFTVSMGEYAGEASEYAKEVSEIMGIDPGEWMRNQGIFMTLATGFGVAGERASLMSEQLTQLGYDISSFFNISVEDAMQKLQSGISGELEPLRRLGYDLSQAKLEATALSLGIDKSVSSMTQAEKAQLRYYAIMTQVTTAHGDMADTLNEPANQMRIFKSQVTQAARAVGSIFIPALNAILPYAIAATKIVRILANEIASLFGYELPEVEYSGIDAVVGGAEDASDALDNATESAKKLKSYMLGFDELNVIDPNAGGNGSDNSSTGGGLDFELPTYDFLGDATESRVSQIVDDMKEWLGITGEIKSWSDLFDTKLGDILIAVGSIGLGLLAWKLSDSFLTGLATFTTALGLGILIDSISVTLGEGLSWKSAIEGAIGGALIGAGLGFKFGGWQGAIGGIIIGIGVSLVINGIAGSIADGVDIEDVASIITGVLTTVGGIITAVKLFNKSHKNPVPDMNTASETIAGTSTGTSTLTTKLKSLAKNLALGLVIIVEVAAAAALIVGAIWLLGVELEQVGIAWQPVLDNGETITTAMGIGTAILVTVGTLSAALGKSGKTLIKDLAAGTAMLILIGVDALLFVGEIWAIGSALNKVGKAWQPVLDNGATIKTAIKTGTAILAAIGVVAAILGALTINSGGTVAAAFAVGTAMLILIGADALIFLAEVKAVGKSLDKVGQAWQPVLENGNTIKTAIKTGTAILAAVGVVCAALGALTIASGGTVAAALAAGTAMLALIGADALLFLAEIRSVGKSLEKIGIAWQPVLDNGATIKNGIKTGTAILVGIGVASAALGVASIASVGLLPLAIAAGTGMLIELSAATKSFVNNLVSVANKLNDDLKPALDELVDDLPDLSSDMEDFTSFMGDFAREVVNYTKSSAIANFAATIDKIVDFFTADAIKTLTDEVGKQYNKAEKLVEKLELAIPKIEEAAALLEDYNTAMSELQAEADSGNSSSGVLKYVLDFAVQVKNNAATWWSNVKTWWNGKVGSVSNFSTDVKNSSSSWWSNVKTWWNGKVGSVSDFKTNVKDSSSTWWSNVKTWWNADSKNGVDVKVNATKGWSGTIKKALGIEDSYSLGFKLPRIKVKWGEKEVMGFKISFPSGFETYAQGGFPDFGQMFIAREAGPELVGTIGNKNAVVNNDQIVESVSTGVYQAVVAALGSSSDEGGNTNIVITLDGEKIYENQQKVARNRGYNLGMGAFSFG